MAAVISRFRGDLRLRGGERSSPRQHEALAQSRSGRQPPSQYLFSGVSLCCSFIPLLARSTRRAITNEILRKASTNSAGACVALSRRGPADSLAVVVDSRSS